MVGLSTYFLTLASVSAVLAGICVTLRNFSYSTLIDPNSTGLSVGERDYPEILKKSGYWSTWSSILFLGNTGFCLIGLSIDHQAMWEVGKTPSLIGIFVGLVFFSGIILMTVATLRGFFQTHQPESGEPAATEPISEEAEGNQ